MLSGRDHNVRYLGAAKTHYTAFVCGYLNEAAVMEARNRSYPGRAGDGYLIFTPGNEACSDRRKAILVPFISDQRPLLGVEQANGYDNRGPKTRLNFR